MIRFTGILAFAAIVQFVVMGIQAVFMHRTKRSFEKGERARLFVSGMKVAGFNEAAQPNITVTYSIHNTGRTAANVYEQNITFPDNLPDDEPLPKSPPYEGGGTPAHFTLAAGRKFDLGSEVAKNEIPYLSDMVSGKRYFYVIGFYKYRDTFGDSHVLRFAERYKDGRFSVVIDVPGYNTET
jgi:hypothetical protein